MVLVQSSFNPSNFSPQDGYCQISTPNADEVNQFRPIAMANFKFKIIPKILADRLAQIMPSLISRQQREFIHGRKIKDCILIALEAINLL
jgi:hypothetical protein